MSNRSFKLKDFLAGSKRNLERNEETKTRFNNRWIERNTGKDSQQDKEAYKKTENPDQSRHLDLRNDEDPYIALINSLGKKEEGFDDESSITLTVSQLKKIKEDLESKIKSNLQNEVSLYPSVYEKKLPPPQDPEKAYEEAKKLSNEVQEKEAERRVIEDITSNIQSLEKDLIRFEEVFQERLISHRRESLTLVYEICKLVLDKIYKYIPEAVVEDFFDSYLCNIDDAELLNMKIIMSSDMKGKIDDIFKENEEKRMIFEKCSHIVYRDEMDSGDCTLKWDFCTIEKNKEEILKKVEEIVLHHINK